MSAFSAFAAEAAQNLTVTIDTGASVTLSDSDADGYYEIGTADALYAFAALVNSGNTAISGELTTDIVVNQGVMTAGTTGARAWTPIGNDSNQYKGIFDGNNKTVSGLYFKKTSVNYVGLFGYVGESSVGVDGEVKNTGVINSYFKGKWYVGGVVGINYGKITNCYNTGTVSGSAAVSGVVGSNRDTITNCYNTGTVSCNSGNVGGVVSVNYGKITNCYNTGTVSGDERVGGVVSYNSVNCTITNCYNTGTVSGSRSVGGVVSYNNGGTITNCYNTGSVRGNEVVGGVAGVSNGTITNCYYLNTACTGGIDGSDVAGSAEVKTADVFASGEVAYLLQGEQTVDVWGQKINEDAYPVLGRDRVYYGYISCADNAVEEYTNNSIASKEKIHSFEKGICTVVEGETHYQPAVFNNNGTAENAKDDYYEISNAGQLYWFADKVNNDNANYGSANAVLTKNIVVNEDLMNKITVAEDGSATVKGEEVVRDWTPIGNDSNQYKGIFDGNNKTVSGLYFNDDNVDYVGLFGSVAEGGEVKNTGVINSYFSGKWYVGGVAGYNAGKITNCYNTGAVSGDWYVGGVAGWNAGKGKITNCYNTGTVSGSSIGNVGGVAAYNNSGTITNCYYLDTAYTGGINGSDVAGSAEAKTADTFASGEVAYLLQAGQTADENGDIPQVWGQKIGTDNYPTLGGDKVYYGYASCADDAQLGYTNLSSKPEHNSKDGVCTVCGFVTVKQPKVVTTDNYTELGLSSGYVGYYAISNVQELCWFTELVNGTLDDVTQNTSAKAVLLNDIILNQNLFDSDGNLVSNTDSLIEWTPIGNYDSQYSGTFDGNNKTISGIYVNSVKKSSTGWGDAGLFGFVGDSGEVKNTGVINSYFSVKNSDGRSEIGSIAGCNKGNITNCYNTGKVVGSATDDFVGGLAGYSYGNITNCYNTGTVSGKGYACGIAYYNDRQITNCYNTGKISSSSNNAYGVTYNGFGSVTNSYFLDTSCARGCVFYNTSDTEVAGSVEAKTADAFASGEIAYLLQGNQTADVWGQKIGTEDSPVLGGNKVYQVTNCLNNTAYSNTNENIDHIYNESYVCTTCGALEGDKIAGVAGYSLSLGGNIAVNYYMVLADEVLEDENAKMVFTVPDGNSTYTVEIPVSEAEISGEYYMFTCEVPAKEMTSQISAKIVTSDKESDVFNYSVKKYAEVILADPETYADEIDIVKAMLNYGANAQVYFNYNTDNLANDTDYISDDEKVLEDVDLSNYAHTLTGEQEGVSFYGAGLSLKSETAIKLYFSFENETDVETLDITVDGNAVTPVKNGSYYEIKISDIPAHKLGDMYEIKVGGLALNYGAFSYGSSAMNTSKDNLKNVIKAMYAYNQATTEYLA